MKKKKSKPHLFLFIFILLLYVHDFSIHKLVFYLIKENGSSIDFFKKGKKEKVFFKVLINYWIIFEEPKNQSVTFDLIWDLRF